MGKKSSEYVGSRVSSVIGKATEFEGTLKTHELLRIEGLVKGTVISDGTIIIGKGGKVEGKVEAVNIMVGGVIEGELFASGKVEATPTGEIYGDIHTKALIVDEKAIFQGRCEMLGQNQETEE